jgi:hypothetical protein
MPGRGDARQRVRSRAQPAASNSSLRRAWAATHRIAECYSTRATTNSQSIRPSQQSMARFALVIRVLVVADCLAPWRTILAGCLVGLLLLRVSITIVKKSVSERVRNRRLIAAASLCAGWIGETYLLAFKQVCARQATCGVVWDLSCNPTNRAFYDYGMLLAAVVVAGAAITLAWPARNAP